MNQPVPQFDIGLFAVEEGNGQVVVDARDIADSLCAFFSGDTGDTVKFNAGFWDVVQEKFIGVFGESPLRLVSQNLDIPYDALETRAQVLKQDWPP